MFIKKTKKKDPTTGKEYSVFQLVESVRTEKGPRQRIVLHLGSLLKLKENEHKLLANRIEELLHGIQTILPYPMEVEHLAQQYANQLLQEKFAKDGNTSDGDKKPQNTHAKISKAKIPDYQTIDVESIEQQNPRTVGAEHLLLHTARQLKIPEKLKQVGMSEKETALALGSIIGRAIHPSSERGTHRWLKRRSGLGELLDFEFDTTSCNHLYAISDKLLHCKMALENHLTETAQQMHQYRSTLLLYDLTNTYMEGQARANPKAKYGRSKEKRSDCPLVTLGLVVNEHGFAIRSSILSGNIGEASTLQDMIHALNGTETCLRPIIVLDAGIASEENLAWLRAQKYPYIVSARQNAPSMELAQPLSNVENSTTSEVKIAPIQCDAGEEKWFYCESEAKAAASASIEVMLRERFEKELLKMANSLIKPLGRKKYPKVLERLGRLKEKYKIISPYYEVVVHPSDDGKKAVKIEWQYVPEKAEKKFSGHYFLRTYGVDQTAAETWKLYTSLTTIEDAFRFMKSSLGMRPIYHQKERRVDGHLWITLLAYHLIQTCLYQLKEQGMTQSWETVLDTMVGRVRVTMQARMHDGKTLYHRSTTKAEPDQCKIYQAVGAPTQILKSKKTTV
jgi:transposase